jgi:hypothetical protein
MTYLEVKSCHLSIAQILILTIGDEIHMSRWDSSQIQMNQNGQSHGRSSLGRVIEAEQADGEVHCEASGKMRN